MASIEIENASVRYYVRKRGTSNAQSGQGAVGGRIVEGRHYLEIDALNDVSLSLADNDRVGLIGINGSGKSTLLKLCAGALALDSGSVKIKGKVSPQFNLGSGVRPQLTARRNAELKCLYMGVSQSLIPKAVEEVKELSGLGGYFELPLSACSAGMRSRFMMSLLHLVHGEILIMDEWINTTDPSVNQKVSKLQSNLINRSSILILASHSERVLKDWTKSLLWLDRGKIRAYGPVDEVYAEYQEWLNAKDE